MPKFSNDQPPPWHAWRQPLWLKIFGPPLAFFALLGVWLALDLQREYEKVLADTAHRAMQRSQIIGQSIRTKVLASDYVLRDVLGRIQASDLVYPDVDRPHAEQMTKLLKEKADTVPEFFSMVLYNRECVFTATATGKNTGVQSKQELCEARKRHRGPDALASYVSGQASASGRSVLVLSRHLQSAGGDFQGGVLGVIELDQAQKLFDLHGLDSGDSVALLDADKVLLARHPLSVGALEKPMTTLAIPAAWPPPELVASVATQVDIDGRERIFGFSKIEGFPFIVAFGFDKAKAVAAWNRRAMELTAGFFVLLLLSLWVARSQWQAFLQREELRSSEEHFRLLAENMADIVWRTDTQQRFTYINEADHKARGFTREEVVGTYFRDNLTPQGRAMLEEKTRERCEIETSANRGMALKYDLPMRHKNGGEVWIEMSSVPIYGSDGAVTGYQGVGRDVSGRRQHEADLLQSQQQLENQLHEAAEEKVALQQLATRDPLTGLYNRRSLDAALARELSRAEHDGKQVAVIMLDLDHFKRVNDQYGHAAGDRVLVALAELLKNGTRESDLICRYGGEEFVAIMPNMLPEQALERVESWRKQLEETVVDFEDFHINITLSAGIAVFPEHGGTAGLLLTRADEMLYKSKQDGRNRVTVCA